MTGASSRTSSCRRCRGEDITIYGDGSQTRSFCYVDDLIRGFLAAMDAPRGLHRPGQSRQSRRVHHPASSPSSCIEVTGSRSKLVRKPLPVDDPRQRCPDISLARESFGWEPRMKLRQGLERTIAFFEQELALATAS